MYRGQQTLAKYLVYTDSQTHKECLSWKRCRPDIVSSDDRIEGPKQPPFPKASKHPAHHHPCFKSFTIVSFSVYVLLSILSEQSQPSNPTTRPRFSLASVILGGRDRYPARMIHGKICRATGQTREELQRDVNGKVVAMSTQTTINLMGRIPTPGVRGTFPPFPVYGDFTVAQWIPYVLEDEPDPKYEPEPVRSPMEQSVRSVMSGQPGALDKRTLEEIVRTDMYVNKERTEDLVQAFKKDGGDLSHYTLARIDLEEEHQPESASDETIDGDTTSTTSTTITAAAAAAENKDTISDFFRAAEFDAPPNPRRNPPRPHPSANFPSPALRKLREDPDVTK